MVKRATGIITRHTQSLCILVLMQCVPVCAVAWAQATPDPSLVQRALAAELRNARDPSHPMRYVLRKSSPRLTTAKAIIETHEGVVARLFSVKT